MSTGKTITTAERRCAWAAALLLAVFLTAAVLGFLTVQMMTSAGLHLSVAADDGMIDRQYQEICGNIDLMAEEYGFSAEDIKGIVSREALKELNRKSAAWWTRLLTEGENSSVPRWDSGPIEDIIYAAADGHTLTAQPQTVVTDLTEMIENTVFPMRGTIVGFGTKMAKRVADVSGILRAVRKLPMLGLVLSLAFAGVIALLLSQDFFRSLKYYGTAIAAAGIIVLAGCIGMLILRANMMLPEASPGMAAEFRTLFGKTALGAGTAAAVLLIIGYGFLAIYRRGIGKRTERTA